MTPSDGNNVRRILEGKNFHVQFAWHLDNGTRSGKKGDPWIPKQFAGAVIEAYNTLPQVEKGPVNTRAKYTTKTIKNTRDGRHKPPPNAMDAICKVFFGAPGSEEEKIFRAAWQKARGRAAPGTPVKYRAVPRPYPKLRRLANFSILTGDQGDTPDNFRLYLHMMLGEAPIAWAGGTVWIGAKAIDVHLRADDYSQKDEFNRDRRKKGCVASSGVWKFHHENSSRDKVAREEHVDPGRDQHPPLIGALPGMTDMDPLVTLVPNGINRDRASPRVDAYIPGTDHRYLSIRFEPDPAQADRPRALEAVVEAFLRTCPKEGPHGFELGHAEMDWVEDDE